MQQVCGPSALQRRLGSSGKAQQSTRPFASAELRCNRRPTVHAQAELASNMQRNQLGERDATQAETVSGFSDKPLGFYDTSHVIRGPDGLVQLIGLSARRCKPDAPLLSESEINRFRNQVPGWRLMQNSSSQPYLRQEWGVKDFQAGIELFARVKLVAEEEKHHPDLHLTGYNKAAIEMSSHSLGGLTENDFIIAARINAIAVKDLLPAPKMRFWA